MENTPSLQVFLGGNTAHGFHSLYAGFAERTEEDFLWVIKGGPGCGKSTFMKRLAAAAESAGLGVERVLCSGDPSSLDGIYIPALHCGYVDGTSPHVIEAALPAAGALYLDLGSFYRPEELESRRGELSALFALYREQYRRAYELLAAASAASPWRVPGLLTAETSQAVEARAAALARRHLGPDGDGRGERFCFLSANTCAGRVSLSATAAALCPRLCTLDNELGLAPIFLERIRREARERGLAALVCPDPLEPERTEAVLLPERGLGFLAVTREAACGQTAWRHLRLDAMADADAVRGLRGELREAARLRRAALEAATGALARARLLHDAVERIYNPHVDFDGVAALAGAHTAYLLARME